MAAAGTVLAACAPQIVKETVIVEKTVKETVLVDKPVTRVVKETVIVEPSPRVVAKVLEPGQGTKAVVSIARIENQDISGAVVEAIDLLGGIESVTSGKNRIMLKPNLRDNMSLHIPPNPQIVSTLARLMQEAGKQVSIGEGSMLAEGINLLFESWASAEIVRTENSDVLDALQQAVFEKWRYTELAESMGIPLINLHTGDTTEVAVPDGFVFDRISLNSTLASADLVCSVPSMKTSPLAAVSLGMENMMGAYPGGVYGAPLCMVHELAANLEPQGTAPAVVDIVRATNPGLVVISGLVGQEGTHEYGHHSEGKLFGLFSGKAVVLNLIIAGTNPLATDMVGAKIMGFEPEEIPTFEWAWKAGMEPTSLDDIEIRGAELSSVTHKFERAIDVPYSHFGDLKSWCNEEV